MSLEAMKSISDAEEQIKQLKAETANNAKGRITAAIAQGESMVAAALKKAETELEQLNTKANTAAKNQAMELARQNEGKKDLMRAKAESNMNSAIELIIERIVNS